MNILGINAYHGDSSACLLQDGKIIAAVEEERFLRVKHWAGFPAESIRYCLKEGKITLSEIDHVALNTNPNANLFKKIGFIIKYRPDFHLMQDRFKNKNKRARIDKELMNLFPGKKLKAKIHYIEHHLSHLASAHYVSPYENSVVVSVDGLGDFSSGAWGVGFGNNIKIQQRVYFPHSLGIFYQALTQFLGFMHYGDEYKVMGLAPYGKNIYMDQMRKIVLLQSNGKYSLNLDFFQHHLTKTDYQWKGGAPVVAELFSNKLEDLLGFSARDKNEPLQQHHHDIAHSVQAMYEEAFFNIIESLHSNHKIDNLTLAGGCAMNSVANGKIYRNTNYKNVYIQSAAGDAGGAIGSAFVVANKMQSIGERFEMKHAYWGPSFDNDYCRKLLEKKVSDLNVANCSFEYISEEKELCDRTADSIANGLVIGWFQGRMEWGPRALGNRSILCDPRRADMKDILNKKIKRRESFRPFAPSILRNKVTEWFDEDDDVPFMMKVFQVREEKRARIPAVTHVDGSGRLQTVFEDTNPRYHKLISAFDDLTGVPLVLNTSFNENEPIVCRPEEALNCFLRTKMDVLVLGDCFVKRG